MKTTVEIPDPLFRKVKAYSNRRKKTFKEVIVEALTLVISRADQTAGEPDWKRCFGRFRGSREETQEIQNIIDRELSIVNPDEWK